MSNYKHTPGPWEVKGYGSGIFPSGGNHPIVCSMTTPSGFISNHEANSKLIAAAPELLEALQNMINANPNDGRWDYQASCDAARRIIKKATE